MYISVIDNPLVNLHYVVFKRSFELKLFEILNGCLKDIDIYALHDLSVNLIVTDDFHLCCISMKETFCPATKPWYISCSDILRKQNMKGLYTSISIIVILLNATSILILVLTRESSKTFSVTVISINLNDSLCGVYPANIWISNIVFKDQFIVKEEICRSGAVCFIAFGVSFWFSILIQLVLIFLSLSRLMIVFYPIYTIFKITNFVKKSLFLTYLISFCTSLSFTVLLKCNYKILTFSLCLPFIDPTNSITMIKVIT